MNTTNLMRWGLLAASVLVSTSALAADWRVYNIVPDKDLMLFYAASDLIREGDHVRVWTENLHVTEVKKFDLKAHPEVVQKVTDRFGTGYLPPFAVQFKKEDAATGTVTAMLGLAEELAD